MNKRANKKKRGGIPGWAVVALAVLVIGAYESGIFSSDSTTPAAPAHPQTAGAPRSANLFALQPANNNWPPGSGRDAMAADLLARNYYVVMDGSGSMGGSDCVGDGSKLTAAKTALNAFMAQIEPDANIGLLVFDSKGVKERLPLGQHDEPAIRAAINAVQAGGGTPLSTALEKGHKALNRQAARQLGYGEYHLVMVTDGEANAGFEPNAAVNRLLESSPIVLHTIGFCIGSNHSLNQQGLTLYKAADDPASLSRGLAGVLAEAPDFTVLQFEGN